MIVLLDTHTFLWWAEAPARLSARAMAICVDPTNTVLLSVTSIWEIQIKQQLGKLTLQLPLADLIAKEQSNGIAVLDVRSEHVYALGGLPTAHKDPFDRMLVAQANVEGATLLSLDPVFQQYPVSVIW